MGASTILTVGVLPIFSLAIVIGYVDGLSFFKIGVILGIIVRRHVDAVVDYLVCEARWVAQLLAVLPCKLLCQGNIHMMNWLELLALFLKTRPLLHEWMFYASLR
jgi:hypothetical protein